MSFGYYAAEPYLSYANQAIETAAYPFKVEYKTFYEPGRCAHCDSPPTAPMRHICDWALVDWAAALVWEEKRMSYTYGIEGLVNAQRTRQGWAVKSLRDA